MMVNSKSIKNFVDWTQHSECLKVHALFCLKIFYLPPLQVKPKITRTEKIREKTTYFSIFLVCFYMSQFHCFPDILRQPPLCKTTRNCGDKTTKNWQWDPKASTASKPSLTFAFQTDYISNCQCPSNIL